MSARAKLHGFPHLSAHPFEKLSQGLHNCSGALQQWRSYTALSFCHCIWWCIQLAIFEHSRALWKVAAPSVLRILGTTLVWFFRSTPDCSDFEVSVARSDQDGSPDLSRQIAWDAFQKRTSPGTCIVSDGSEHVSRCMRRVHIYEDLSAPLMLN